MVRILHAPLDVGGNAAGLARAERELGFGSDVAVFTPGPFGYEHDVDLEAGLDNSLVRRFARRAAFLRRALDDYDVFHFNFGQTLLTVRQLGHVLDELPVLRRLGKTILMTYQGCDVRPKAMCPCRRPTCFEEDRYRLPAARRVARYADRVLYLNPDLGAWLPAGRFVPYANVDPRAVEPIPEPEEEEVVVLHAPTDLDVKGTAHVVDAVEALRREGLPARLEVVQGVTRRELLERIAAAHVVVDQLLIGWYGGFAVEAMASGRPVLAYIREDEPADNPFGDELPVVRTRPATLVQDLRALAVDAKRRRELGSAGRRFAELHHDPRRIARDVLHGLVPISDEP